MLPPRRPCACVDLRERWGVPRRGVITDEVRTDDFDDLDPSRTDDFDDLDPRGLLDLGLHS